MRVQESYILVHVEDVAVGEALDIFVYGDDLLEVLILAGSEDGVVDYYAVDFVIGVCVDYGVFEELAVDFSELECESTVQIVG